MKILSADLIKACDLATIEKGISSGILMERAACGCADWIARNFQAADKFVIFCGPGNNGGDGFAAARMLYEKGFDVDVFADSAGNDLSPDAKTNFRRIQKMTGIEIRKFSDFSVTNLENAVIVDAIFGYGLNRELAENIRTIIEVINQLHLPKIAIDMPTGLFADDLLGDHSVAFQADYTLTFQFFKRSFLHPESGRFCGQIIVLDIGLDQDFISKAKTDYFVIDEVLIKSIYKPRDAFGNKGTFGKSILVGGSYGKMGAILMATRSALRSGSGLTITIAPECGNFVLQSQVPEAMFICSGEKFLLEIETQEKAVYGIGPGLGQHGQTGKALFDFLKNYRDPVVLDADALNILADHQTMELIPKHSVITPHPLEFERLFGKTENSFERLELAKKKAEEFQIFIILKDHHTAVITPEKKVFYNITGNSGMAKGGSGDVLTGILTSFLAQKYSIENACIFGVWLHGKAGDITAVQLSKESMLPTDLLDNIGKVFRYLSG